MNQRRIFLIAGEPSGDILGAALMRALKVETKGRVEFSGLGGDAMRAEGLEPLFDIAETSIMGIAEVVPRVPNLLRRIKQTITAALAFQPDAVVTIDSPDFCHRVSKVLHMKSPGITLVHYVAPSVWAWRQGRAKKLAGFLDHILALLPFEPEYFIKHGLSCDFVGHPLAGQKQPNIAEVKKFRQGINCKDQQKLVLVLPGSRQGEVRRLMPVFGAAMERLAQTVPSMVICIPAAANVADLVRRQLTEWPSSVQPLVQLLDPNELSFIEADHRKFVALAAGDAALAASGTISLELTLAQTPMAIAYQANKVSAAIIKRVVNIDTATIANLVLERNIIPEFLQDNCTAENLANSLESLLGAEGQKQVSLLKEVATILGQGQQKPELRAAKSVLAAIERKQMNT